MSEAKETASQQVDLSLRERLTGLGMEEEAAVSLEQVLSGLNLDQLSEVKSYVDQKHSEQKEEIARETRVPNPIPGLVEALKTGAKLAKEGYHGTQELPLWAGRVGETIDTAKVVSYEPDVEIVKDLIERGKIQTGVTLEELHDHWRPFFMVQDIVPTLKELGVIPKDAPERLPYNEENGYLIKLFKKEGDVEVGERPPEGRFKQFPSGTTELTKDTKFPGVKITLGIGTDVLDNYRKYMNGNGYPMVRYQRLEFSPEALASMAPSNQVAEE